MNCWKLVRTHKCLLFIFLLTLSVNRIPKFHIFTIFYTKRIITLVVSMRLLISRILWLILCVTFLPRVKVQIESNYDFAIQLSLYYLNVPIMMAACGQTARKSHLTYSLLTKRQLKAIKMTNIGHGIINLSINWKKSIFKQFKNNLNMKKTSGI